MYNPSNQNAQILFKEILRGIDVPDPAPRIVKLFVSSSGKTGILHSLFFFFFT